ncbi:MAG: hypothetical protein RLY30_1919 [Pseudomonadota bacterium]|jgi:acyl dehydratase
MRTLEDFCPGDVIPLGHRTIEADEIIAFGKAYDSQSFHTDPEAAKSSIFGGLIASGWQTAGICMRLICDAFMLDTASNGSPGIQDLQWLKPVRPGDTLTGRVEVLEQIPSRSKPDRGASKQRWVLQNQHGETVFTADVTVLMMRRKD